MFRFAVVMSGVIAVLAFTNSTMAQQPRIPPDAHGYQRYLLQQQSAPPARSSAEVPTRRTYTWDLPPQVPLDRTYTWYALPAEFQVVIQATPSQPRLVTLVQPDGSKRTFVLEGPVVVKRPVVVRR